MKVSVLLSTYGEAKYLRRAVDSILNQDYHNFELIICVDGFNENTIKIVKEYCNHDNRVKYIVNEGNRGLAYSLNRCASISSGEYLARMDDDDISECTRLQKEVEFLEKNPKINIVGTSRIIFDECGVWGEDIVEGVRSKEEVWKGLSFIHPSVMMRKKAFDRIGGYTVGYNVGRSEDYDMWCKMYFYGYVGANIPDKLLSYYEGKDSFSKRKFKYRLCSVKLRLMWFERLNIPKRFFPFAFKPIAVGLLPNTIVRRVHRKKYIGSK